ncbi:tRNA 2-thiouridine(34) synthase MnmA [Qiania dongpingensis]|uniref:tRNA-specific 2-thiouridylase MnmA n=1 Tax=Qiania dongpingensis TaxID=2763669 RepID=A0A7G9G3I7_9FIRM|nr:tRNA 2-thiouridine(34) synthase MnmA [Qiania dongpingensis]QNM05369.1 tRNA 2-thiouridine(34) synthase MnmA [Qiania dongpingensis]
MKKKKVVVGMSGGVDSSVAACLLLEQGYEVIGVTMQIWQDEDRTVVEENGGCCGLSAVDDARRVAGILGIPYYVMNFKNVFREKVMDYFVDSYVRGKTPNPCIACNRYVKWEALLKRSLEIGADYIATGHYARVEALDNGRMAVRNSVTAAKDQTYALYNLTQDQLRHTLMPVGAYAKEDIRRMAEERGLPVASKPDSQEICFVPDNDYAGFIERNTKVPLREGNYVDRDGNILGRHKGITHYTIGQRKGLNLSMGHPVFVTEIRPETDEVVIGEAEDVFTDVVYCSQLNFMALPDVEDGQLLTGKIRYAHKGAPCRVKRVGRDALECRFSEPVRAVTPGQALVLYDGEYVAGGGTIVPVQDIKKEQ